MSSCFPISNAGLNYITYPVGPTATGKQVTTPSTANTKGSYVQFVASTTFASQAATVGSVGNFVGVLDGLIDVATGASGSEVVVVSNIPYNDFYASGVGNSTFGITLPLAIAASTRIAIRCQTTSTNTGGISIFITLVGTNGMGGITSFTSVGATTTTSRVTTIDPGGTANTKGSYTQLTASTATVAQWLSPQFVRACQGTVPGGGTSWFIDIATGASGSEVVLMPDLVMSCGPNGNSGPSGPACPNTYPMLTYIAASTRLAVRASCGSNTATERTFDITLIFGAAVSAAATSFVTNIGSDLLTAGTINWLTTTFLARFIASSATPSRSDTTMATGYTAIGTDQTITSPTQTINNTANTVNFFAANPSWPAIASGSTIGWVVIYYNNGTNNVPIAVQQLPATATNGTGISLIWDATGVFYTQE